MLGPLNPESGKHTSFPTVLSPVLVFLSQSVPGPLPQAYLWQFRCPPLLRSRSRVVAASLIPQCSLSVGTMFEACLRTSILFCLTGEEIKGGGSLTSTRRGSLLSSLWQEFV